MRLKNFKFQNTKIYITNFLYTIFKIINHKNLFFDLKKINKIMSNLNIKNVDFKLKMINKILSKNDHPVIFRQIAAYEIDKAKNPEVGFKKIKDYNIFLKDWLKRKKLKFFKKDFIPPSLVVGALGNHLPLFYYLKYRLNKNSLGKPYLLLLKNHKVTNSFLYKYFIKHINIIKEMGLYYKLNYISKIFEIPMGGTLPFKDKHYPFFASINFINQDFSKKKKPKFDYLKLNKKDLSKGRNLLKKIGIPKDAWYVTLHIREGKGNKLFNSNPITYMKAIKEIIRRGGYVFRMGDKKMTRLPKIQGLVDYPFTSFKSQFLDVFLASTCRFCLGTSSGFWSMPTFFGKPVLLCNYLPYLDYYILDEKSVFLPKTVINKKTKKNVNLKTLFKFPLGSLTTNVQLDQNEVEIKDNNEEEIYQSTIQMINLLENNTNLGKFTYMNKFKKDLNKFNKQRYDFPLKAFGNMSNFFLKKYN